MFGNGPSLTSACPFVDISTGCRAAMLNVILLRSKMLKKTLGHNKPPVLTVVVVVLYLAVDWGN